MGVSIRGTVRDLEGRPLSMVKVVAAHEPTGSLFAKVTGEDGQYLIDNIKAGGPYALSASGEGFLRVEERLQLKTDQALDHDFTMARTNDDLDPSS